MKKILQVLAVIGGFFGIGSVASAYAYTTDEITATMSATLDTTVNAIVSTVTSFLTTNFPLIVILGVSIGLVFWLVRKATRATRGK